jgi:4-hydroxybenzoate polyprenyltransferase
MLKGSMEVETGTPLVVDLDGTLIRSDSLHDSAIWCLFHSPADLKRATKALRTGGIAAMKEVFADRYNFDPRHLPYNESVLDFLNEKKSEGQILILATGANEKIAHAIAEHLDIFEEVFASDQHVNNTGAEKVQRIKSKYQLFDYIGNSRADQVVWKASRVGYVVADGVRKLPKKTSRTLNVVGSSTTNTLKDWLTQLRPHQWAKNVLVAVSIIASHRYLEIDSWTKVLLGFAAFSLLASSVYIFNDLSDVASDRKHSRKRSRSLASGRISSPLALVASVLLAISGFAISLAITTMFSVCLIMYLLSNIAYTFKLKKVVVIDVLLLAFMYTARIWAGALAINEPMSFWIASFSIFIFLSLALMKRFSEILAEADSLDSTIPGRGYRPSDSGLVMSSGIAAGFSSVIFLALYLDSQAVSLNYASPVWLWGSVPLLLGWLLSLWFRAGRGDVDQDPIFFALRDRFSQLVLVGFVIMFLCATLVH